MAEIDFHIIGIQITNREKEAGQVQSKLTNYGGVIKTRLGLNDVFDTKSSNGGIILLDLYGVESEKERLESELEQIEGIDIQKMIF
jgi:hypothetical protein